MPAKPIWLIISCVVLLPTCVFAAPADDTKADADILRAAGVGTETIAAAIDGMDIVDKIKEVKTASVGQFNDVPIDDVVIKSVRVVR